MGEVYLIRTKIKMIECQLCGSRHAYGAELPSEHWSADFRLSNQRSLSIRV
jgi:hypothetical protein